MRSLLILLATPGPAAGQEIRTIDATRLTPTELMALAAAERAAPGPLACCDWGGLGCLGQDGSALAANLVNSLSSPPGPQGDAGFRETSPMALPRPPDGPGAARR